MPSAWEKLVADVGEDEARAEMKRRADLSSRNKRGTGGFAFMAKTNPEKLKQLGKTYGRKKNKTPDES